MYFHKNLGEDFFQGFNYFLLFMYFVRDEIVKFIYAKWIRWIRSVNVKKSYVW